jgi:hypothetical protein
MGRRSDMTIKSIFIALFISLIIYIVWATIEWIEFGEIQNNRTCDDVVFVLYYIVLAIGFSKW